MNDDNETIYFQQLQTIYITNKHTCDNNKIQVKILLLSYYNYCMEMEKIRSSILINHFPHKNNI